ncbi:hypothetical protein D3C74_106920 [compost metagenome]
MNELFGEKAYRKLLTPLTSRRYSTVYRYSSMYCSLVLYGAPHQNQPPFCSWNGRKMTGIGLLPSSFRLLAKSAIISKNWLYSSFFSPPGRMLDTTLPLVSLKSPPVTKFGICPLKVSTPPSSYAFFITAIKLSLFCCLLFSPTPGFSFPSRLSVSQPNTPGKSPTAFSTSDWVPSFAVIDSPSVVSC